jgi:hypothetical protein
VKLSFLFLSIGGVVVQFGRNIFAGAISSLLGSIGSLVILVLFDRIVKRATKSRGSILVVAAYISIFILQYFYSSQLVPYLFDLAQPFDPWYSAVKVTFAVYLASLFTSFLKEDAILLQTMSSESENSRVILDLKSSKNELLDVVNTTTNQGELQGHISGVIMALNLLTKDEDTFLSNRDPSGIINNANALLSNAIAEIQNLSVKDLLN